MTRFIFAAVAFTAAAIPSVAQIAASRITTSPTGFSSPVYGTTAPGNNSNLYVVQQGGLIRSINTLSTAATPQSFFNIASFGSTGFVTSSEEGLLGLAFHPNYATNGIFYAFYNSGTLTASNLVVDQFKANNGVVDTSMRKNVITIPHTTASNHNGGWLGFSPTGGNNLYISTGDGGGTNDPPNNSQNTNVLLGKMLRLNIGANGLDFASPTSTYSIPAGNMTVNPNASQVPPPPSSTVRPEIYAYGLRNPWRNSFDRANGNLYIGDVGQSAREEIDFIANGRVNAGVGGTPSQQGINFGWRIREGNVAGASAGSALLPVDYIGPVFDYVRSGTSGQLPFFGGSVTGGYMYRGPAFADNGGDLNGTYLFTDYISSQIGSFRTDALTGAMVPGSLRNRTNEIVGSLTAGTLSGVSTFAEDGFGNLFMMDYSSGDVYRLVPVPEPALLLLAPLALAIPRVRRKLTG